MRAEEIRERLVVRVRNMGFNPENRRILQGGGDHYIIGERLWVGREGQPVVALRRGGRFRKLACGLEIKEVVVGGDSAARRQFVVILNPEEAEHDRTKRADIVAAVERRLADLQQLTGEPHTKAACTLRAHPVYGRYVRQTKTGRLTLNRARIQAEANLDGKFLVSSSDDQLSAEGIALGYRQLWCIERVHRDLKHVVECPAGISPPGRPHSRSCPAVLAGSAADPGGGERHR
ncbi:MAG: hypothetical protein AB1445_01260 [Bacillota bacterium]